MGPLKSSMLSVALVKMSRGVCSRWQRIPKGHGCISAGPQLWPPFLTVGGSKVIFLVSQPEILRSKWSVSSPTPDPRRRPELGKAVPKAAWVLASHVCSHREGTM